MKFQHFNAPTNREIYNQWTRFHARPPRIFVGSLSSFEFPPSLTEVSVSEKENKDRNNFPFSTTSKNVSSIQASTSDCPVQVYAAILERYN